MKNPILSQALESLETSVPDALPPVVQAAEAPKIEKVAGPAICRVNTDEMVEKRLEAMSRDKVVMNAPLSTIFTRALNISLAKKDVATGEYSGQTPAGVTQGEAVAVESQAQDAYYGAQSKRILQDAMLDPKELSKPEVPDTLETSGSGTKLIAPATQEETIKFFNSNELEGVEPNFVFYQKVNARTDGEVQTYWDNHRMIMLNEKGGQGTYVVESIQIVVNTRKVEIDD